MPEFTQLSKDKLSSCHPNLQILFKEIIKYYDCTILEGHRTPLEQQKLVAEGKSLTLNSKHTKSPSMAVDVAPCPINWKNAKKFYHFVGYVQATAKQLNIKIRCGADWNSNNNLDDQSFNDLVHFELL